MCGITGIWNLDGRPIHRPELDRFTDSLAHRGPDGRGVFVDKKSSLGLGHRRLAILDTSERGAQPKSYWEGRYWITFNGEIFNFLELRAELIGLGYHFFSETDTEVVLAAFHAWGEDCLFRMNGMWAFAIWDRRRQELFLARDRFGIKPLFYALDAKKFCFASELKAFLHLDDRPLAFDPKAVVLGLESTEEQDCSKHTVLQGVQNLLGGHSLLVDGRGHVALRRWWNTLDHLGSFAAKFSPFKAQRLRELLHNSVSMRMTSDVPVAFTLSGGLDSSSLLCVAAREKSREKNRLHRAPASDAFVATYSDPTIDEFPYAQQVLEATGVQGHLVKIDPEESLSNLEKIVFDFEGVENVFASVWMLYRKIREAGYKVALDGHGSDELLGGYVQRYIPLLGGAGISPWRRWTAPHGRWWDEPGNSLSLPGQKPGSRNWVHHEPHRDGIETFESDLRRIRNWHPLDQQLYVDFHMLTLPKILRNFDRLSMAHGVEVREPFLDWRIVCFVMSLNYRHKISKGRSKHLLRNAMTGILPESIRNRTSKRGFNDPWFDWMRGTLKPFILDTVQSRSFFESEFWNGPQMQKIAFDFFRQGCPADQRGRIARVWRCVQTQVLYQQFAKARSGKPHVRSYGKDRDQLPSTQNFLDDR